VDPGISICSAEVGDADAIARLSGELGYPVEVGDAAARLPAILGDNSHSVLVAVADGQVVGWIHVRDSLLIQEPPGAELGGLIVAEGGRGAGSGRALLAAAEGWAQSRGHHSMRVRSRTTRCDAHRFYLNAGYRQVKASLVFEKQLK